MSRNLFLLALVVSMVGCGEEAATPVSASAPTATPDAATSVRYLERPFTAEQIRDAMPPGLVVLLGHRMPGGEVKQRWTVVDADAEGVSIEYAGIGEDGKLAGDPQVSRNTWAELRDHAQFPADRAQRKQETRETPLGRLDGWLYTLQEDGGKVTEFFFASSMPGAPIHMKRMVNGQVESEMFQLMRTTPPTPR